MIHISNVLPLLDSQLKVLQPKEAVRFKTYKKDRGFLIYCIEPSQFQLVEHGFTHTSFTGDLSGIKKQARKALKREFPRSNMVWVEYLQHIDSPFNVDASHSTQGSLF